ncbi:MAG: alpha/beta hydrolase [Deltaproteobacteria bacterium]|nr:alpha/beta hydrolase [Deltaproteobacteria bacterium]
MLLLHGLGSSSHVFEPLRARWPAGLRGVAVDLPCCGRSAGWAPCAPGALAGALAAFLREERLDCAAVVGHSFGGLVALELLARGAVTRGLLLATPVGGAGRLGAAGGSGLARWTLRVASHVEPSAPAVRAWLSFLWGEGPAPTPGMVQGYLHALSAPGHAGAMAEALGALSTWSPPRLPPGIPLQLLQGGRDPLVSRAEGAGYCAASGASLRVLEGVGHCLPEEAPDAVAAWLSLLESGNAAGGVLTGSLCNGSE